LAFFNFTIAMSFKTLTVFGFIFFSAAAVATIPNCQLQSSDEMQQVLHWSYLAGENSYFAEFGLVLYHQDGQLTGATMAEKGRESSRVLALFPMAGDQQKPHQLLLVGEQHEPCSLGQMQIMPQYPTEDLSAELLNIIELKLRHLTRFTEHDYDTYQQPFEVYQSELEAIINGMVYMFDGQDNPKSIKTSIERMASSSDPDVQQALSAYHYLLVESQMIDKMFNQSEFLFSQQNDEPRLKKLWNTIKLLSPLSSAKANLNGLNVMQGVKIPKNGAELSKMMKHQLRSDISGKPEVGIYRDLSGLVAEKGYTALNAATGNKVKYLKALQKGGELYNAAIALWGFADKLMAGFFPNELVDLDITWGPNELSMTGNRNGAITDIKVTPKAPGIDLATVMLGTAIQSAKVQKTLGLLATRPKLQSYLAKTYLADGYKLIQNVGKLFPKTGTVVSEGVGFAAPWSVDNLLLPKAPKSALNINPFKYPPVDIMQSGYFTAVSQTPGNLEAQFDDVAVNYFAKAKGLGKILVQSAGDKFANSQIVSTLEIQINDGEFTLSPQIKVSAFGQQHRFELKVYAQRSLTDFELTFSPGLSLISEELVSTEFAGLPEEVKTYALVVKAPANRSQFPATLSVQRNQGTRLPQHATMILPNLTPRLLCIEPGETYSFNISTSNGEDNELQLLGDGNLSSDWQMNQSINKGDFAIQVKGPGTVSNHWDYQLDDNTKAKQTTIQLVDRQQRHVYDEATFTIGCQCQWQATTGNQENSGVDALWVDHVESKRAGQFIILSDKSHFNVHQIIVKRDAPASGVITFSANCDDNTVDGGWLSIVNETAYGGGHTPACEGEEGNPGTPELTILAVSDKYVQGRIHGSMIYGNNAYVKNHITFTAARVSGKQWLNHPLMSLLSTDIKNDPETLAGLGVMMSQMGGTSVCHPDETD
jgi:hypothetical protein